MILSRSLTMVGLCLLAAGYVGVTEGCSSSSSPAGPASNVGAAPTKPDAPATTSKDEHNFALNALLLGEADRTGALSGTAWKKYGFNIDGKVSTKTSTDVCTPASGANKDEQVDGDDGIDNAFGSRIVPIIQTFDREISKTLSKSLTDGSFTIMIDTIGLTADPKQTNTALTGQLFAGAKFDNPTFSPSDQWPVRKDSLNDGNTLGSGAKVKFGDSFVVNGMWVNGNPSDVALSLSIGGQSLDLVIHKATLVFQHDGAKADNGTIAGVINTQELISGLQKVAGHISTQLCAGSAFDSIAKQIAQASDIMSDGTNNAGAECDAISVGIGFTAAEIAPPSKVSDLGPADTDKCSGGGGDGGVNDSGTDAGADTGTMDAAATD